MKMDVTMKNEIWMKLGMIASIILILLFFNIIGHIWVMYKNKTMLVTDKTTRVQMKLSEGKHTKGIIRTLIIGLVLVIICTYTDIPLFQFIFSPEKNDIIYTNKGENFIG